MLIKRKEVCSAIIISVLVALLAVYSNIINENYSSRNLLHVDLLSTSGKDSLNQGIEQHFQLISETIEGELNKGTFEDAINKLEILTEEEDGYVKSLRMIYTEGAWSGQMICKVPPTNVTPFTFGARAIIEANGTVTYINISIEDINASQQNQESTYATINLNLKEVKPSNEAGIVASLTPVLTILTTSLLWIAQGLIIGVPLCFVSLGIVILVDRGIIPLWKNTLKKPK